MIVLIPDHCLSIYFSMHSLCKPLSINLMLLTLWFPSAYGIWYATTVLPDHSHSLYFGKLINGKNWKRSAFFYFVHPTKMLIAMTI